MEEQEKAQDRDGVASEPPATGEEAHSVDDAGTLEIEVVGDTADTETSDASKLAELEAKQKETFERLLRATADLDNFRKRTRRDLEDAKVEASSRTLREFLPVIDNLERALQHASADGSTSAVILDGVRLVLRQFEQALEHCGVKAVEVVGAAFDPHLHEAVSQIESEDHPPGTVVESLQKGYRIKDRLLRPALVVVSMGPATVSQAGEASESKAAASEGDPAGADDSESKDDNPQE